MRETMQAGLRVREWDLDGFTVRECGGYWSVENLDRLPPGWYRVEVGYDVAADTPTLSVLNVEGPTDPDRGDTYCYIFRPNADATLATVHRP